MGKKNKYGNPLKEKAYRESQRQKNGNGLKSSDDTAIISIDDHISGWEDYKKMVDDVYFNQKRRTKKLDAIHAALNHVGDEVEAKVPGQGAAFVEHLCQQMKKIVFLSWDTNKNHNFITGVEKNEQSQDALSFHRFKGFSEQKMNEILSMIVSVSFFEPDDVYHYLD